MNLFYFVAVEYHERKSAA